MRAAGLRASAAQPLAAERLDPDDGADHVPVHIAVPDAHSVEHMPYCFVDPAVDPQGEAVAGGNYLVERGVEPIGPPARDVQDRPEYLVIEQAGSLDFENAGRKKGAVFGAGRQRTLIE